MAEANKRLSKTAKAICYQLIYGANNSVLDVNTGKYYDISKKVREVNHIAVNCISYALVQGHYYLLCKTPGTKKNYVLIATDKGTFSARISASDLGNHYLTQ